MKSKVHTIYYTFGILMVIMFSSCRSVFIIDSWEGETFQSLRSEKILVIGQNPDHDVRKQFELKVVGELMSQGVNAVASHLAFPELENKQRTTNEIDALASTFRNSGFQSVIIIELVNSIATITEEKIIQEQLHDSYNRVYGGSRKTQEGVENNIVYKDQKTTFVIKTNTYNLKDSATWQLLKSFTFIVTDPKSTQRVLTSYCKKLKKEYSDAR